MVTKETIEQFFRGECDPKQAAAVKALFEEKPEFFAQFFSEAEWEAFVSDNELSEERSLEIWRNIHREIDRKPLIYYIRRLSVAATLLIVLSTMAYYLIHSSGTRQPALTDSKKAIQSIYNGGANDKLIKLSDSSLVWLMPGGTITFSDSFIYNRSLSLSGGAIFEVKRDPRHPFVVKADSIYTTVLGTKFTVQSNHDNGNIKVMLYEGKVAVQKAGVPFNGKRDIFFLNPGETLVYKAKTNEAILEKGGQVYKRPSPGIKVPEKPESTETTSGLIIEGDNWYMFNNQSLAQTFDYLEVLYNTRIDYNAADIKGMTFIGKVDNSDSLYNILRAIALLNNLQVVPLSNGYLIKK